MSGLTSFGDWLLSRHRANLSTNVPAPAGVESYDAWYRRIRGLSELVPSPTTGPATSKLAAQIPAPSTPGRRHSVPSLG